MCSCFCYIDCTILLLYLYEDDNDIYKSLGIFEFQFPLATSDLFIVGFELSTCTYYLFTQDFFLRISKLPLERKRNTCRYDVSSFVPECFC